MVHAEISPSCLARALSAVVIAAALTAGCTVGPSLRPELATFGGPAPSRTTVTATVPIGPGGSGRAADPIRWLPCPSIVPLTAPDGPELMIDCAEVTAPISPPQPRRGSLTFPVARARVHDVDLPPLVVLPDTGTADHTAIARIASDLPAELRENFTIIVADPRGTGGEAIDCVGESTAQAIVGMAADPRRGGEQLAAISRQLTFDCGDAIGPALTKFNSTNAADDLDVLRAALRVDRLSVLADGSGATIGALYAHRYPGRVASMVLSSPSDPTMEPEARAGAQAAAATAALTDFTAWCSGLAADCPLGADPDGAVRDLVDRFADSGLADDPWVMTGGSVLLALIELLPQREMWPELAQSLADLQGGEATPLADLLISALGGSAITAWLSSRVIYTCNDSVARPSPAEVAEWARSTPEPFGPFTAALAGLCGSWPAPDEPAERLSAAGVPPILVVGAAGSITPPFAETRSIVGQLSSAVLVTWQSTSRFPYPASRCVATVVNDYLLTGQVPERGVLCPP